ncbi:phage holin family protein [Alkalicoccobacillus gibsonii]|uniref:phage holin family protein n=1 Tax=Alkalicoccobacillus gibsonii TaxID=79881 RepID=UPI001932FF3C|nr:phage holin family protein [Alkalicoccobacillus gibsonii]MBM0064792.1 phage holin family protein [Alkalicoccobacillus gibsonii]
MENISLYFSADRFEAYMLYLFGGVNFIDLLFVLMLLDIATGILKAIKDKDLRSRSSYFGYVRKIMVFGLIIVANIIDNILGLNGMVATTTVLFYIANEILSIVENSAKLGLPIPPIIMEKLRGFDKYGENNKEDE